MSANCNSLGCGPEQHQMLAKLEEKADCITEALKKLGQAEIESAVPRIHPVLKGNDKRNILNIISADVQCKTALIMARVFCKCKQHSKNGVELVEGSWTKIIGIADTVWKIRQEAARYGTPGELEQAKTAYEELNTLKGTITSNEQVEGLEQLLKLSMRHDLYIPLDSARALSSNPRYRDILKNYYELP